MEREELNKGHQWGRSNLLAFDVEPSPSQLLGSLPFSLSSCTWHGLLLGRPEARGYIQTILWSPAARGLEEQGNSGTRLPAECQKVSYPTHELRAVVEEGGDTSFGASIRAAALHLDHQPWSKPKAHASSCSFASHLEERCQMKQSCLEYFC